MGLFTKYKENQEKFILNSVVSQLPSNRKNTLFDGSILNGELLKEEQIIQTTSTQDVTLGRVESSLFKNRQELDQQRIENFLKTPGGQTHKTKEVRLARTNPIFSPESGVNQNPTRFIIPDKVAINAGLSGGGIFEDKFSLFGISNNPGLLDTTGYVKYLTKPEESKLSYLSRKYGYDKELPSRLESRIEELTNRIKSRDERGKNTSIDRILDRRLERLEGRQNRRNRREDRRSQSNSFSTKLGNFINGVSNVSSLLVGTFGYRTFPKEELYSYSGGPESDNGIGLTTVYKYDPITFNNANRYEFYDLKNNFSISNFKNNTSNYKENKFWTQTGSLTTIYEGSYYNGDVNFLFYNTNDKLEKGISDYYNTKNVRVWKHENKDDNLYLTNPSSEEDLFYTAPGFRSITGSLDSNPNSYYNSSSIENEPDNIDQDIIPFRIEIINLEEPSQSYYLYFKAFIDSFSDDFRANYESIVSPGNPTGKMFKYQSFDRTLSLSFKIAIFRKEESEDIYRKLNRLVSTTLPTNTNNAIRSTITKLTVGNWCKRLPGVITTINFSNLVNHPWDIDEKRPMVIDINMSYQYSSIYDDNNPILYSSPDVETKLMGNINAA